MQNGKTPLDIARTEEVKAALREHGGKHSLFYAAEKGMHEEVAELIKGCLLYTSPSPRDQRGSRMPSSA